MKIKVGDKVRIVSGADKGKIFEVTRHTPEGLWYEIKDANGRCRGADRKNIQLVDDYIKEEKKRSTDILHRAIRYYGVRRQMDKAVEEMSELIQAIQKIRYSTGREHAAAQRNLLEEIADVSIMVDQLRIICGESDVEKWRRHKLDRLERRMEHETFPYCHCGAKKGEN